MDEHYVCYADDDGFLVIELYKVFWSANDAADLADNIKSVVQDHDVKAMKKLGRYDLAQKITDVLKIDVT